MRRDVQILSLVCWATRRNRRQVGSGCFKSCFDLVRTGLNQGLLDRRAQLPKAALVVAEGDSLANHPAIASQDTAIVLAPGGVYADIDYFAPSSEIKYAACSTDFLLLDPRCI